MKKFLKEKGFTGQDIIIATFSVMVFLSLITSLMLNLTKTSIEIKRMQNITKYLSMVADNVDAMDFSAEEFKDNKTDVEIPNSSPILNNIDSKTKVKFTYSVSTAQDGDGELKTITIKGVYDNSDIGAEIQVSKKSDKRVAKPIDPNPPEPTPTTTTTPSPTPTTPPTPPANSTASVSKVVNKSLWPGGNIGTDEKYVTYSTSFEYNNLSSTGTTKITKGSQSVIPIRFMWISISESSKTGKWIRVTDPNDLEWYSIEEGILPTYTSVAESQLNNTYNPFDSGTAYVWLPKTSNSIASKLIFKIYPSQTFTSSRSSTTPTLSELPSQPTEEKGRMIKYGSNWTIEALNGIVKQRQGVLKYDYKSFENIEVTGGTLISNTYLSDIEKTYFNNFNRHTGNQ